jgi:capsular exopolysaccharide synthesis family protein
MSPPPTARLSPGRPPPPLPVQARIPSGTARRGRRHGLPLAIGFAAGLVLAAAALAALPAYYVATTQVLTDGSLLPGPPQSAQTDAIAKQVMAGRASAGTADAAPARPGPRLVSLALSLWLRAPRRAAFRHPEGPAARLWSHVVITLLGRSSRVAEIRAAARDPRQAAALANAVARRDRHVVYQIATALPPTLPSFPPAGPILLSGALLGTLLGYAAILTRRRGRGTFRRIDDAATAMAAPVMAVVPRMKSRTAPIAQVLRAPHTRYADALRRLHGSLRAANRPSPAVTVAVGSAVPSEGRSVLAASLGRLLASEGTRVLLIDCDWRHPILHRLFHLPNETGLTALLADAPPALDDIVQTDMLSGLDIVTFGRNRPLAAQAVISPRMRRLLDAFAGSYDLVLLDTPPVLSAGEAALLFQLADQTLFTVRWGHTRRCAVRDALDRIARAGGDIAGVALTRAAETACRDDRPAATIAAERRPPRLF